jgi:hypothetical protein
MFAIQALSICLCAVLSNAASVTTERGEKASHLIRKENVKPKGSLTPDKKAHGDDAAPACADGEWYSKVQGEGSEGGPWCEQACLHLGAAEECDTEVNVCDHELTVEGKFGLLSEQRACEYVQTPEIDGVKVEYSDFHHNMAANIFKRKTWVDAYNAAHPSLHEQIKTYTAPEYGEECNVHWAIKGEGDNEFCQSICAGTEHDHNLHEAWMEKHGYKKGTLHGDGCNPYDEHGHHQWAYLGEKAMSVFHYPGEQ